MKSQYFEGRLMETPRSQVCLLFDPKDGRVVHGHGVTVLQSDKQIEPAELEARARRHARGLGKRVEDLQALHLPLEALHGHAAFKVNPEGNGIVPIARGPRRARRGAPPRST